LNWKDTGKFLWRPDFRPRLNEWVADFALVGKAALDEPDWASRMVLFRLYYLGLAPHETGAALSRLERAELGELDRADPQSLRQRTSELWHVSPEKIFYVRGLAQHRHTAVKARGWSHKADGGKIGGQPRVEGKMDPETKRAWSRLTREVREDTPIVLRGLASEGKQIPRKFYSAVVRGMKSLTSRAKEWEASLGGRRALVSQLARVRLRSPIYKV